MPTEQIPHKTIEALAYALSYLPTVLHSGLQLAVYTSRGIATGPSIKDTMTAWNALPPDHPLKERYKDQVVQNGYSQFPIARQLTINQPVDELLAFIALMS